jgi:hypothetical protein
LNVAAPIAEYQAEMDSYSSCVGVYSSALMLGQLPMKIVGSDRVSERGLAARWSIDMDMTKLLNAYEAIDGDYQLSYLDYDCSWQDIGNEVINADGTGQYINEIDADSCEQSELTYTWEKTVGYLHQTGVSGRYRDSCDGEWIEDEPSDFDCQIIANSDSGFYCLETLDGEQSLYRYTR